MFNLFRLWVLLSHLFFLKGATVGVSVSPQVYTQLLAIYLFQNDLCNAKYLWKRIPASVKTSHPELQNVWKVGQRMWQRDFPGTYVALNEQWSNDVAEIMQKILGKFHLKLYFDLHSNTCKNSSSKMLIFLSHSEFQPVKAFIVC